MHEVATILQEDVEGPSQPLGRPRRAGKGTQASKASKPLAKTGGAKAGPIAKPVQPAKVSHTVLIVECVRHCLSSYFFAFKGK